MKNKFFVLGMLAMALTVEVILAGCDNGTSSEPTSYSLNHGITLQDPNGLLSGTHVQNMKDYLNDAESYAIFITNITNKNIIVVSGNSKSISGNDITMGVDNFASKATLDDAFVELSFFTMNKSNSNIRLAHAAKVTVCDIWQL
jgi:hypothetical protein